MSQALINQLKSKNLKITTAESCTGGLIASTITEITGSSAVFDRGYVTYSNQSKIDCLNIPSKTIEQHGAVSHQTARAMAEGALKNSNANISIATTGIAGPAGGSEEKPVGLVYFALGQNEKETITEKKIFEGARTDIQKAAAKHAINMIMQHIGQ